MKKFNKIYMLMIFLSVFSCNNALDLEPVSSISGANFWQTEDDASGALYGMYARFRGITDKDLFLLGETRNQNLKGSVGFDGLAFRLVANTLEPVAAGPNWSVLYKVVNDANYILKFVPDIEFNNQDNKNRILAEAYTMRAYCYFIIVRTWGDAILRTEPTEGYNSEEMFRERSPVADVFSLIKNDIEEALSLFPDNEFIQGRNRWSKPGINALKADVYLWTGKVLNGGENDFKTALDAINVVETGDIALLPDFSRVFDYDNKGNKEIIFASNHKLHESGSTFLLHMYIDKLPNNPEPDAAAAIGVVGGGSYWTLTDESRSKFSDDDQRKNGTFIELYYLDEETNDYTNFYGCIQTKFNGVIDGGSRQFLDDVIIYRYADILLMKAEAENALGQDPSASINKVRLRAYGENFENHIFVNGTKAENDSEILDERLRELFYEGKRWWDLIRFDKVFELVPYFQDHPDEEYKLLWPIGTNILTKEPKVEQNPGWGN